MADNMVWWHSYGTERPYGGRFRRFCKLVQHNIRHIPKR